VPAPGRTPSGYRDYGPDVVERLAFVRHAQAGGLTLSQIRQDLEIGDSSDAPCEHVGRALAGPHGGPWCPCGPGHSAARPNPDPLNAPSFAE
jgi:hypothetical protein